MCLSIMAMLIAHICPSCMSILHAHAACPFCISLLHFHAACPWCLSVHVYAACLCYMPMLHFHVHVHVHENEAWNEARVCSAALFEKQNWIVGNRWTFPFHRKKNNTLGLGDFKFLSFSVIGPFWSGKNFYILVPIPILYYSQCSILEEGNNTLYRWELMVWEGWKEHTYCVYV